MGRPKLDEPKYRVRQREGSDLYYVFWTEEGRTRSISTGKRVQKAADIWAKQFIAGRNAPVIPEQPTVGEILDSYLADRIGQVESLATLTHACKPLRTAFGALQPRHISRPTVRKYIRERQTAGRSNGTIIRELVTLRAALTLAVKDQWIERAPYIDVPPAPPPRTRWLTKDEVERLLAACKADHLKLFIAVALHTAARAGAILDLTWDRVDLEQRRISLGLPGRTHATKRRAIVPINPTLYEVLEGARDVALSDYVIEYAGLPVGSVKMAFRRAAARAGLKGVSAHTLRHTAATWMVQEGVPLPKVARYLGDTEKMVERVYGHHAPDYLREAARALG